MKNKKMILIGFALVVLIVIGLKLASELSDSIGPSSDIEVTGLSGSGFCGKIVEKWKNCERNEDCVTTESICKWPMTFNRIYKSDIDTINACMGRPANCAKVPPPQKGKSTQAQCRNSKCEF